MWKAALYFLLGFQAATGEPVDVRANEVRGEYRIEWTDKALARGLAYTTGRGGGRGRRGGGSKGARWATEAGAGGKERGGPDTDFGAGVV